MGCCHSSENTVILKNGPREMGSFQTNFSVCDTVALDLNPKGGEGPMNEVLGEVARILGKGHAGLPQAVCHNQPGSTREKILEAHRSV